MMHGAKLFFLAVLLTSTASAQADIDALIEQMAEKHAFPAQQTLAEEITDALIERLQQEPLEAVYDALSGHAQQNVHVVTWEDGDRRIGLATLWHRNNYQPVRFNSEHFADKVAYSPEVYPIIQWRRADGSWAAQPLYSTEGEWPNEHTQGAKADFYEIHKLSSPNQELYLLLGVNSGTQFPAYLPFLVIGFDDDELVLDYPAFEERHPLLEATVYDNDEPAAYLD